MSIEFRELAPLIQINTLPQTGTSGGNGLAAGGPGDRGKRKAPHFDGRRILKRRGRGASRARSDGGPGSAA
jgi:hypothetical protein